MSLINYDDRALHEAIQDDMPLTAQLVSMIRGSAGRTGGRRGHKTATASLATRRRNVGPGLSAGTSAGAAPLADRTTR
ncbi:hypothetical protein [Fulvimarina pelagi]|uniref:hypothetical protein n=1 Tax=Fulvimarina pelagi TaxID=217511 RepID=UPI0011D08E22|nr:hypothetical protein [Fulvimarina pelagi]